MSWWEVITTEGRSIQDVCVCFERNELRVSVHELRPSERPAVLIDHLTNRVQLFEPFLVCQLLLAAHQYEIVDDREPEPLQAA